MNKTIKIVIEIVLFIACVGLVYAIYSSIMEPVNFNKRMTARENIAIQRLKDIRTLQVAYKSANGKFTSSVDSLKDFYENGQMVVVMQVGSADDSSAVAHTQRIRNSNKKITNEQLFQMYRSGDKNLVFSVESKIPVKDTLFKSRTDFNIVSGVPVPLFEASMPYKDLLKGLNNQLRINLDADRKDQNKFPGLQVGSITAPNNNAGNWE